MTFADAMARYGTDKPDLRFGLELVELTDYFARRRSGCSRRRTSAPSCMPGGALAAAPRRSTPGRSGPSSAAPRASRTSRSARTASSAARSPRTSPTHERAGLVGGRRREPRRRVFFAAGTPNERPGAARRRAARDRPPRRPDRRGRLGVRLGRRRAAVQADGRGRRRRRRRRRLDGRAPRVHLAHAGVDRHVRAGPGRAPWRTPTTSSATATRSAAGRSVSTAATCRSACSTSWASARRRRRRSSASCSTRSSSARRRTAGSRSAGTGSSRCSPASESIRDVIAFPKSGGGYDPLTGAPAPITPRAAPGGRRRRQAEGCAGRVTADVLDRLPPRWREHRYARGDGAAGAVGCRRRRRHAARARRRAEPAHGSGAATAVAVTGWSHGVRPPGRRRLDERAARCARGRADVLAALGLRSPRPWDWVSTDDAPAGAPGRGRGAPARPRRATPRRSARASRREPRHDGRPRGDRTSSAGGCVEATARRRCRRRGRRPGAGRRGVRGRHGWRRARRTRGTGLGTALHGRREERCAGGGSGVGALGIYADNAVPVGCTGAWGSAPVAEFRGGSTAGTDRPAVPCRGVARAASGLSA